MSMYILVLAAGVFAVSYIAPRLLIWITQDIREPPVMGVGIPFLGPILGMATEKERFYVRLSKQKYLPIYTLRLPFLRIYVVNETRLIPPIQKQWHRISFGAIAAEAGTAVGMSNEALAIMKDGLDTEHGFTTSWPRSVMPHLSPGKDLDDMNRTAVEVMAAATEKMLGDKPSDISLKDWTREVLIDATTRGVWGPENPYKDSAIREAWKKFEAGFITFSMFPGAKYLFPKLLQARELVATALVEYVRKGGYKTASGLVRFRYKHHVQTFGLTHEDFARGELGNTFAVLGNTVPCSFWMAWHIFSDARVLADIRTEVTALVHEGIDDNGKVKRSIDLSGVRDACPILVSTFQEVIRYRAVHPGPRVLLEDVTLDGDILLKKGSMLMIPAPVQHFNTAVWGDDAASFNYLRFFREPSRRKPNRTAFRGFGGGHSLCPGRHFSSTEMMALIALLVAQFDMTPVSGNWREPTWKNSPAQAGFPVPDQETRVNLVPRFKGETWNVTFSGSETMMAMVAEDEVEV